MNELEMKKELESLKEQFKAKWESRFKECKEEPYKFYRRNRTEILEDFSPIGELAFVLDMLGKLEQ